MDLATLWFVIIAVLWLGYLFLEGFDFGVGMLLRVLGRTEPERRVLINTIGPVWDGNEVWLLVAGGATFAAFPGWYASLFSTAYVPLLIFLLALIGRGVMFEYRGKVDSDRWRNVWDWILVVCSWVATIGVGAVLVTNVFGLPIDEAGNRVGGPLAMLDWYSVLGGLAVAGYALVHGAVFIALKTEGDIRARARRLALRAGPIAVVPLVALLVLVGLRENTTFGWIAVAIVLAAAVIAWLRLAAWQEGQAFALLGLAVVGTVMTLFAALHPYVVPSTVDPAFSLTIADAASSPYTLEVMSWVALFGTPAVLIYQGWTYWVFRQRIAVHHMPPVKVP
ncbi:MULTISPECIES: cytochrome d ubiquinol oxidase subunit II [Thermocrispum]|jgi:cytochrome d ubiquinol oxidase subunit II|uniref:cytochrome d ubiquinol oxidase subunit II n=1 Tax=Thermocrispum TaxID=37924 RepID=UPI0004173202|nr:MULTISPECIES: cytochrome d ubiquinol oxidase subunit II [Thermocrispum]